MRKGRFGGLFRYRQPKTAFTATFGGPDNFLPPSPGSGGGKSSLQSAEHMIDRTNGANLGSR